MGERSNVFEAIRYWSEHAKAIGSLALYDMMFNWLHSPEAAFVPVPREKIEALRAKLGKLSCGDGSGVKASDACHAILACAEPPAPKDEVLEALKRAIADMMPTHPRYEEMLNAAVIREAELRDR